MAATSRLKSQIQPKSKRRKRRETVISTTVSTVSVDSSSTEFPGRKQETAVVVVSDGSWCCAPSKPFHSPSHRTSTCKSQHQSISSVALDSPSPSRSLSSSSYRTRVSPGRVSPIMKTRGASLPPSCSKFNNALNGKLLSPIASSPPPQNANKTLFSPTLFEMMSHEQDCGSKSQITVNNLSFVPGKLQISAQEKQTWLQERVAQIVGGCSPGNLLNDTSSSDVRVNLRSKDGLCISMNVHRQILMSNSKFFASKLSDHWSNIQKSVPPHLIEISDCDDIEIYVETLRLMYCKDIRKKLMREKVPKVLGILQVCSAIGFDVGVLSCLEYLEASPWAEDEEEKVTSALSQLHLSNSAEAEEVLKRVSAEIVVAEKGTNEETLLKLLQAVLQGKDEKARRDMKALISKMLRENTSQNDISMESLYFASHSCLQLLRLQLLNASSTSDSAELCQISRQADNLHWILGILIDRQIASDFVKIWADQTDLSDAHSKVPAIHRYEISKVTAKLFVAIGKAQVLASKEVRCMLLKTWLEPFYRDYGWMTRSCKGLDRHLIEDGLSNTVLTLPLSWQKEILLSWFKRFMNSSDDCPNLHRAFEGWWRRVFWRRRNESVQTPTLRFAMDHENSINLN